MATRKAKKPFSKAPLGSGGRFKACTQKMKKKYGAQLAKKVCAAIGRKAYGAKRFQQMAAKGRKK